MLQLPVSYSVLLLPAHEVVAQGLTHRDAAAWVRTYNETLQGSPSQAVLAEETLQAPLARRTAA